MEQVIFGLGSNLGDREAQLKAAVRALEAEFGAIQTSSVYESAALLPEGAPEDWNIPYWNMAARVQAVEAPVALLAIAKCIEEKLGRKESGRWAPREIDVDILAVGGAVLSSRTLTIPHKELLARGFALLPLAELAPDWRYPVQGPHQGRTAKELSALPHLREGGGLKKLEVRIA